MIRKNIPPQVDQKRLKQLFEGSLMSLNGGKIPESQQPILKPRQDRFIGGPDASKAAIAAAANSLAALWQISSPRRPHTTD